MNDSISYITKKHCHSLISVICTLLLAVMAAHSLMYSFQTHSVIGGVYAVLLTLTAVFSVVMLPGGSIGCILMQIPIAIFSLCSFFGAVTVGVLGFLFLRHDDMETYFNGLLGTMGYVLTIESHVTGIMLFCAALLLFLFASLMLLVIRYLRTVRRCLNDDIARGGTKQLEFFSFLLSFLTAGGIVTFLLLSGDHVYKDILSEPTYAFILAQCASAGLLFFCLGILSLQFGRKTYAFRIFEDQLMKVETNADGTVYVPINEDTEEDDEAFTTKTVSKAVTETGNAKKHRITEIPLVFPSDSDAVEWENSEQLIL